MLVGFDIETAQLVPNDRSASYKLGITCAAVSFEDGTKFAFYPGFGTVTFNWLSNSPFAVNYTGFPGEQGGSMSQDDLIEMIRLLEKAHNEGHDIITWNGAGFDFRVLYDEMEGNDDSQSIVAALAANHLDVMFQVLCLKGYPVGMEACSKEMLGKSKVGMHGDEAVAEWAKGIQERERVIKYVQGDADLTVETGAKIKELSQVKWITRAGKLSVVKIPFLVPVRDCLNFPKPDTSWMTNPIDRDDIISWINLSPRPPAPPPPQMPMF